MFLNEKQFLSEYDITKYPQPSVTTDIVLFTMRVREEDSYRHEPKHDLSLLLIKRGEHPYKGCWALPGGFVRPNETVEECAYREITEEANITPAALMNVAVFSKPDRDPRGRVISNAFLSIAGSGVSDIKGGDDAAEARWFDISFERVSDDEYKLILTDGDVELISSLRLTDSRFGVSSYDIISSEGLAFDHAAIIAVALDKVKKLAADYELIFDFLPEKFTLTELQRVQETLMNITILPANFRRKISAYVEETDEFTSGAGHRPAKLYKRKL